MSERENKKSCIGIDVSKGSSHFQAFYSAGVPASELTYIEHTKRGFSHLYSIVSDLEKELGYATYVIFENTGTYSKPVEVFCQRNNLRHYTITVLVFLVFYVLLKECVNVIQFRKNLKVQG